MQMSSFEKNAVGLYLPTQKRITSPTKIIGVSGTAIYSGYIEETETHSSLIGSSKYTTFSNIVANTAIVAAGLRYFLNMCQKAGWSFNPVDDSAEAMEIAELTEMIFDDMETPWSRVIRRAAMYKFYGFSIQEWTAKRRRDGKIGFLDIAPRAQKTIGRWDVDDSGRVKGVWQDSPKTAESFFLPRQKLLYLVDDSLSDSPEGLGIFRNMVAPVKRLERYEQLEGFGYESDLRGVPVGRAPYAKLQELVDAGRITSEEATARTNVIEMFIQKHIKNPERGIVLDSSVYESDDEAATPSGNKLWGIELLDGSDQGLTEVHQAIERLNHEIARLIGVEQLLLGQTRGTQALSEDKSHNFALVIESALGEIAETVNRDVIMPLGELNGWDENLLPKAQPERLQFNDPSQITQALADLASAMLDPEDPAINVIREQLGLPDALVVNDQTDASLRSARGTAPSTPDDVEDLNFRGGQDGNA